MPIIEKDEQGLSAIIDLSEDEKELWRREFGGIRERDQHTPSEYIDMAVKELGGHEALRSRSSQTTSLIFLIRETAWNIYIQHEQAVCGKALVGLLKSNQETRSILKELLQRKGFASIRETTEDQKIVDLMAEIIGDFSGRIFPYQYELSKSVTQSRRSRAGTSFERVIRHVIDIFGFPCDDQSKAGTELFEKIGLGKIVDGLLPGLKQYNEHRAKCAVLTMKTTLRERWQEVVEELHRTNVPHIYLLTLDDDISESKLATMKSHNITLVAPDFVKQRNSSIMNLISFDQLFNKDLPHLLSWWEGK